MKKCACCGESKPLEGFHRKSADPSGRQPYCIECNKAQVNAARKGGRSQYKPWPDKVIGYGAAHDRAKYARGSASRHTCVGCAGQAHDWSYTGEDPKELRTPKGMRYSTNPLFYVPRCKPCHKKYDTLLRMEVKA